MASSHLLFKENNKFLLLQSVQGTNVQGGVSTSLTNMYIVKTKEHKKIDYTFEYTQYTKLYFYLQYKKQVEMTNYILIQLFMFKGEIFQQKIL